MATALSPAEGKALYRCLFEALQAGILDNVWKPGDLLPSEAAIGARFGVSRITVRHALQLLQIEGYIRTQRAHRAIVLAREPLLQGGYGADTIQDIIRPPATTGSRSRAGGGSRSPRRRASSNCPRTRCCIACAAP